MLYYAATTLKTDGAIMVTGSHNPPDYNGFKMVLGGKPFFGERRSATWARMAAAGDVVARDAAARARRSTSPSDYIARLARRLGRRRPCAERGVGQRQRRGRRRAASDWSPRLPGEHTVLNGEIDGRFPAPSSGSDGAGQPRSSSIARGDGARRADIGIALRRRRRPHRRWWTTRARSCSATSCWSCWRATCCARIRAPRSSPT